MDVDLLEEQLVFNVKSAKHALKKHRERKQQILVADVEHLEPHVEEEEEEEETPTEKKRKSSDKKKPPAKKAALEGPCAGRVWLNESECPGADAKRGRNPEADAHIFLGAIYEKKRYMLCKSCKNEYTASKKKKEVTL